MKKYLLPALAFVGLFSGLAGEVSYAEPPPHAQVLDLKSGKILGVALGMDEVAVKEALAEHQVGDIKKVAYTGHFLLQSTDILGLVFFFDDHQQLTRIYTNSKGVIFSNGLKLGQDIAEFDKKLGKPVAQRKLASGAGSERIYALGDLQLEVIVLDVDPDHAQAVTLRKSPESR